MQVIKRFLALLVVAVSANAQAQIHQARGQYAVNYKEHVGAFGDIHRAFAGDGG